MSKLRLISLALCLALLFSLCACGKDSYSPDEVSKAVLNSEAFSTPEKYIALDSKQLESYFGYDTDMLDGFSVYVSSAEEDATEIGVFQLTDDDDRNTIIDGINRHCTTVAETFKSMSPSGMTTQNFLLMQLDDMIIYVVSNNAPAAEDTLVSMGASEIN